MTNFAHGQEAEEAAAIYLSSNGYEVILRNVRTKYYEIDVVAKKSSTIYFVEVKYRENDQHGLGLDYITNSKLARMSYAAELWVTENNWPGDYELAAIEITGPSFTVTEFIPEL